MGQAQACLSDRSSLRVYVCADPFLSDETYMVSVLTLEELGATGNKGLASVMTNPVNQDILGGLAASATAFAAAEVGGGGCPLRSSEGSAMS